MTSAEPSSASHQVNNLNGNTPADALHLQQSIGNQAVQRPANSNAVGFDFAKIGVQPKLEVGRPAQSAADEGTGTSASFDPIAPLLTNRKDDHRLVTNVPDSSWDARNENPVGAQGKHLESPILTAMETRLGRNFGDVRIHTDSEAAQSAQSIGALAFTVGRDIVFGQNQYAPDTPSGERLLAHELAHTAQQETAHSPFTGEIPISPPHDMLEQEADEVSLAGSRSSAVTHLAEQLIQRQPRDTQVSPPVTRPSLSDLRTIAQGYIGDYFSAARAGLTDFERDVQSSFDWGAFWLTVGGNVVWATASFATGGTAFIISLAGIAVSTAASTATVNNPADFHRESVIRINDIVTSLNNEVDRVTREVDSNAAAEGWDDNRSRSELLKRLVKPEFVFTATGGLPNLSQPRVAASIREELLIRASQQSSSPLLSPVVYQGVFEEVWDVDGITWVEYPFSPTMPVLKPLSDWFYGIHSAGFVNVPPEVPDLNRKINDIYQTYGSSRIDPSVWPVRKEIKLQFGNGVSVTYIFDASNTLTRIDDNMFRGILRAQGHDPDTFLHELLGYMQHGSPIPRVSALR
ncbi:MAG: DUF4157 domain-containing protein [Thaumarchaeota archaeon]|nr:DUF4157 domain-containing protein [Nitrososphaerota archaeon]